MTWEEVIDIAKRGYTLILSDWKGYFKWNYSNNQLYFKNGDYYLNQQQLLDKEVDKKTNWYYII